MKEVVLERKIKKETKSKNYEDARFILINCYKKQFKKMIKYKKKKVDKTWFFHDYLEEIKKLYSNMYSKDIDEMVEVLYSDKYSIKEQISWLIDNCYMFNDYKL